MSEVYAAEAYAAFVVEGKPVGKGRPRWSGRHMYTPSATQLYEMAVARACKKAMGGLRLKTTPVRVLVEVRKKIPAHVSKATREAMLSGEIRPMTRPDLDNVVKSVLDGCNGIAYEDDCQVVAFAASSIYAEAPNVSVRIFEEACGLRMRWYVFKRLRKVRRLRKKREERDDDRLQVQAD